MCLVWCLPVKLGFKSLITRALQAYLHSFKRHVEGVGELQGDRHLLAHPYLTINLYSRYINFNKSFFFTFKCT